MNYTEKNSWKKIMEYLPQQYQLKNNDMPNEEMWDWQGNKIHLDTYRNSQARAKVILLHGVGTNGRQMTTIVGQNLAKQGYEVIAIDMPLYGVTEVNKNMTITYDMWVQVGSDYIDYELSKDSRPIFLYGLSAGGMETYHIAAKNKKVSGIIGMTFLDQREQQVRNETTNNMFWAYLGTPLATLSTKLGLGKMTIKMSTCSKMSTLCNDEKCLDEMLRDKTSGGNRVPMKFISTYMNYVPEIEPENFDICPVILTQPAEDLWTPLHLSTPFLNKITKVSVDIVMLEEGGHYPVEKKALDQLNKAIIEFLDKNLNK